MSDFSFNAEIVKPQDSPEPVPPGWYRVLIDAAKYGATRAGNGWIVSTEYQVQGGDFDGQGRRHLEYIRDRGTYDDFPFDEMVRVMSETYPEAVAAGLQDAADPMF